MVHVEPIWIDDVPFTFVHVELPKTDLLVISNDIGYIMCGALDVDLLNEKLAGRTRDELLYAPLQKVTNYAKETYGWEEGMSGKEALLRLK